MFVAEPLIREKRKGGAGRGWALWVSAVLDIDRIEIPCGIGAGCSAGLELARMDRPCGGGSAGAVSCMGTCLARGRMFKLGLGAGADLATGDA